jgi:murein DD-endopeptidase MepM/ murein hydrolase activator NlpD
MNRSLIAAFLLGIVISTTVRAQELPPLAHPTTYLPEVEIKAPLPVYTTPTQGTLTSGYGMRWGRLHQGIDIAAPIGTVVQASAAGVVVFAGWHQGGYGNLIEIRHADGSLTRYAHLNRIWVSQNGTVAQGQAIGEVGSTGYSTGPHLHFEIHLAEGGAVNPIDYVEIPRVAQYE